MGMKTVLITGISKGIGKALAQKFLAHGWAVAGTSTTGTVDFSHDSLTVFPLDLASPESISTCCSALDRSGVQPSVLVNNAGILADEDETHIIIEKLRKTLEVNLIGTIDFTEHTLPIMQQPAHIVMISSSAGSLTDADFETESHYPFHYPAYKISKTALNMYARTLAMNLLHEKRAITVSSVHPGWVKTNMGGDEADITPEEAAKSIYEFAISQPETGQFWFNGKKLPW